MCVNDNSTSTKDHILLMQSLHDLSQFHTMLLQEENQRDNAHHTIVSSKHVAINVKLFAFNKNKLLPKKDEMKGYDVTCDYCKFTGHSIDKCFVLHGYPEWHKLYGQP